MQVLENPHAMFEMTAVKRYWKKTYRRLPIINILFGDNHWMLENKTDLNIYWLPLLSPTTCHDASKNLTSRAAMVFHEEAIKYLNAQLLKRLMG